ncbi:hypothetical protein PVAP13_1NG249276 [Panicum virgatum]|uniref:Uncharacterized protein n=1 Tax=Panicum virgatum TaxID=38727 RepID=A0A8T0X1K8_PANVG|nr:hypothetical protein PVAP13_1NG249276 [Panicum virgatum]
MSSSPLWSWRPPSIGGPPASTCARVRPGGRPRPCASGHGGRAGPRPRPSAAARRRRHSRAGDGAAVAMVVPAAFCGRAPSPRAWRRGIEPARCRAKPTCVRCRQMPWPEHTPLREPLRTPRARCAPARLWLVHAASLRPARLGQHCSSPVGTAAAGVRREHHRPPALPPGRNCCGARGHPLRSARRTSSPASASAPPLPPGPSAALPDVCSSWRGPRRRYVGGARAGR